MKNNHSNRHTAHADTAKASVHDAFFADEIDPAREARAQAIEVITRVFIWIDEAASFEDRGVRSTIALYCVRPDLIGGMTLDKIGDKAGLAKQTACKLAKDFRLCMGL